MPKTKKAGYAKSPAKPIKSKGRKNSTVTIAGVDTVRSNMIAVANRLLRQVAEERQKERQGRLESNRRPLSRLPTFNQVDPRYFSFRRALLCGERVDYDEYVEMMDNAPPMFWEDIEGKAMMTFSNNQKNEVALSVAWYKAKLSVNPDQSFDITAESLNTPYRSRVLISKNEYDNAKGRMPTQAFFDMKFCEAVENIKEEMRRPRINNIPISDYRYPDGTAFDPRAALAAIEKLTEPEAKKKKSPPSPFSLIDLD